MLPRLVVLVHFHGADKDILETGQFTKERSFMENSQFHMAGEASQSWRKARKSKSHLTWMAASKESLCKETLFLKAIRPLEMGFYCGWSPSPDLVISSPGPPKLLGRLRQENRLNPGGGGCSELRSRHCTPAWATEQDFVSNKTKNKKRNKKLSSGGSGWLSRSRLLKGKLGSGESPDVWPTRSYSKACPHSSGSEREQWLKRFHAPQPIWRGLQQV
ncbi:hypothetical protein AAY473_036603 [Plecturocebus cupreus]